jgi:hypothetical protein
MQVSYSSTMKMETTCSCETSGSPRIARRYNPEHRIIQQSFSLTLKHLLKKIANFEKPGGRTFPGGWSDQFVKLTTYIRLVSR